MANALYGLGREGFLGGDIDWDANTVKAMLVDSGQYTVAIDTDQFLSDVPAGARIASSAALSSKTKTLGVAGAGNVVFAAVTGVTVEAVVLFQDTGTEATSRLIAYIDTATGLPVIPNGGDINVNWDTGANKIFKL
ncbi:MAG: hypothetical protein ABL903_08445 [Methylococcales bacterium]